MKANAIIYGLLAIIVIIILVSMISAKKSPWERHMYYDEWGVEQPMYSQQPQIIYKEQPVYIEVEQSSPRNYRRPAHRKHPAHHKHPSHHKHPAGKRNGAHPSASSTKHNNKHSTTAAPSGTSTISTKDSFSNLSYSEY